MRNFTIKQRTVAAKKSSDDYNQGWELYRGYKKAIQEKNIEVSSLANALLDHVVKYVIKEKATKKRRIALIEVSVEELGLIEKEVVNMETVLQKAEAMGFKPCPAEIGLEIMLQDNSNDWRIIGMAPIGLCHAHERQWPIQDVFICDSGTLTTLWSYNPYKFNDRRLRVGKKMKFIFAV